MLAKNYHNWSIVAEKLKKEDFVTIFLVHLHLDVVPEVLLMVGMNFLTHKSPILLYMIDLQRKKKFDEDVPCRVSPGCCSRGSPGGLRAKSLIKTCR